MTACRTASITGRSPGASARVARMVAASLSDSAPSTRALGSAVETKDRAGADAGLGGDLVGGGRVEALLGDQPQRDQLERARAGAAGPAAASGACLCYGGTVSYGRF